MFLGENRAQRLFLQTLKDLRPPGLQVLSDPGHQADVELKVGKTRHRFELKWAGEGFPQDVRRVLHLTPNSGHELVVCAVSFSPGALDELRRANVSYVDESGRARIVSPPGLILIREDLGSHPRRKRPAFMWSPGLGATAELLLSSSGDELPPISVLAGYLPVSMATVGKALQAFDGQGWTQRIGAARGATAERRLVDRSALLGSWSRWQSSRGLEDTLRLHASWKDPWTFLADRLESVLPPHEWCLTGWAAAELLAPYSAMVPTLHLYISEDVWFQVTDSVLSVRGMRPVSQGARISLTPIEPELKQLGQNLALPVASTVRVYADLLREGSRGQDAAEHLREVCLGY